MLVKSVINKKKDLTIVNESCTLEEALKILEDSGYRCVPILDESGQIFRGNIYKMHIYRHKANGGSMDLPVTYLLKNATKFIFTNTSFFKVFFTIKELPYIAVLDENNHFYGILTHNKLLNLLAQSWNIEQGSYVLTIASPGTQGHLATITKIISRYSDISRCITLDNQTDEVVRRILITLPSEITEETCATIVENLEHKNFKVIEIEDLKNNTSNY
ncbi:cyclic di-AMP binding protein CbpA [Melissococcus plutonius]|uniref:CBS domain protein n=1 Tax=Melissococcus plutonius (strain ATCC 35311 / DSM 29964 / CIP 104052 / LMG 20360 / NCIMB 702443) TaxID=940190 RepID=F3YCG2_MELPT|nr:cyclic di-AMP binding protein CbpA [Melissococcus plutonius]AIM25386.1 CBS domain protein [Melissococcus plutonius S1]KMT23752.1 CBS domain protein [Melissococcus plutonius]KMT24112.1 CBS domain protein [Melissococcus plutonius]KMT24512.1 CBS domain protein [Melissococcus plutonius]KMT28757.1 CBS domain protein [Melissococcus plutonius]